MLNYFGIIFIIVLLLPNIYASIFKKELFVNKFDDRLLIKLENIGRYLCMILMVINIQDLYGGFKSVEAFVAYFGINIILLGLYYIVWFIFYKFNNIYKNMILGIIPSLMFIISGILQNHLLLIISGIVFAYAHLRIIWKNR
ncbi:MAG: hypothetical protein SPJ09_03855 [Erysipelotrichaceae bacterium]|nr:hypothetical protein [Erysipelotrichaceae bacterium]